MGDDTIPSDLGDSTYTKPVQSSGGGYANESDPSWEDVIAMVVIPGSPARITQAADEWSALLTRLGEVERVLKAVKTDLETWKGAGGDEYRNHLTMLITNLQTLQEDNSNLPHHLHLAAGDLETAIANIPIPDDMIHEVMAAKQGYIDSGMISDTWGPNSIYKHLLPVYGNKWFDEAREFFTWDWASNKLRDWISEQDNKAKDAYHKLAKDHVQTMALIPGPNPVKFADPRGEPFDQTKLSGPGGGGGGGGGMPSAKMPGAGAGIGGGPSLDDMANPPGSSLTDPNLTNPGGGYDPDDMPGSGLAGAGGGIGGLNPGAGGLGSGIGGVGPGSGLGAGGLGAGGLGRGAGGMGAGMGGGMMPGMGMGGAGAGRGAGRGVTGAGAGKGGVRGAGAGAGRGGVGGVRGGMMPGAAGGGAGGGEGEDHATWLQEDDDPWGSDSEAPPSVLG